MNSRIRITALLFVLLVLTVGLANSATAPTPDPENAPGGKGNAQKACYIQAQDNYDICVYYYCELPGAPPTRICNDACKDSYQEARAACRANN
jgi:hypothetical protein